MKIIQFKIFDTSKLRKIIIELMSREIMMSIAYQHYYIANVGNK